MKFQKPGSLVIVEWNDSFSVDPWASVAERLGDHEDTIPIQTIGAVLMHNAEKIVLVRSFHGRDNSCEGSFEIPAAVITRIIKWPNRHFDIETQATD